MPGKLLRFLQEKILRMLRMSMFQMSMPVPSLCRHPLFFSQKICNFGCRGGTPSTLRTGGNAYRLSQSCLLWLRGWDPGIGARKWDPAVHGWVCARPPKVKAKS